MHHTQPSIAHNVPSDYWKHPYPAKMAETISSVDENCQNLGFDIWEAMHLLRQSYPEINQNFPLPSEAQNQADYALLTGRGEDSHVAVHTLEALYQQSVQNLYASLLLAEKRRRSELVNSPEVHASLNLWKSRFLLAGVATFIGIIFTGPIGSLIGLGMIYCGKKVEQSQKDLDEALRKQNIYQSSALACPNVTQEPAASIRCFNPAMLDTLRDSILRELSLNLVEDWRRAEEIRGKNPAHSEGGRAIKI